MLAPWPAVEAGVATCWDEPAGEPGTSSISDMASFPRATPRRWRVSFVSCMERHERIAIGESDHVRHSRSGRCDVDWKAVVDLLREGKTAEIPCANERDCARREKQVAKRAEKKGIAVEVFGARVFSASSQPAVPRHPHEAEDVQGDGRNVGARRRAGNPSR